MGRKLTNEEFNNRIDKDYELVSEYINRNNDVILKCKKHNCTWIVKGDTALRNRTKCPECRKEAILACKIGLRCDYCSKEFYIKPSRLENKTGLHYCSRECKDNAQKIDSGIKEAQLDHYKDGQSVYRERAINKYGAFCEICNYAEVLDVHHIDENHSNSEINNLIVLCPNCHAKITRNICRLVDRKMIKI